MTDVKELIKKGFKEVETIEGLRGETEKLVETNYPKALKRHLLISESFGMSVEESYFWVKDSLEELGYIDIEKIVDTFTASEQSAFFGSAQQRLGIQQDKATTYLATIGQMTKQLFQIVREIKLLEERETIYTRAIKFKDDGAEKTLKGIWIDFVDNGPQGVKASSIYGLASQIGFTPLPDLFFGTPPALKQNEVTSYVDSLDFNKKLKSVLVRKLHQFVAWRDETGKEIAAKKKFTIHYLRQHYNSIKLYMDWVKPYLRNVRRLGMNPETQLSADIVGAFEGSVVEIEILGKKPTGDKDDPHPCILATFTFRTRPIMQTGQDFQRGPAHIGRMELTLRGYVWTNDEIKEYKKIRQEEDFEMLKSIDRSIQESMDFLGDKLKQYLEEAGEKFEKEEEVEQLAKALMRARKELPLDEARTKAKQILADTKEKKPTIFEPITSIYSGVKDVAKSFRFGQDDASKERKRHKESKEKKKKFAKDVIKDITVLFKAYKKSHKLFNP